MILIKCKFSSVKLVNTFSSEDVISSKTKRRGRDYFHKAVFKFISHLTPPCRLHDPVQRFLVVFHTFLSIRF